MILRRVFLATSALLSVLCSFSSFSEDQMPGQSYWVLQRQIRESFEQHDYTAALEKLREADRTVPGDPNVIFRMAVAYTRVGQPESGLQQVKRLVQMGTFFDLRQEKAFADFLNKPKFQQL